jgi:hypothetical protein
VQAGQNITGYSDPTASNSFPPPVPIQPHPTPRNTSRHDTNTAGATQERLYSPSDSGDVQVTLRSTPSGSGLHDVPEVDRTSEVAGTLPSSDGSSSDGIHRPLAEASARNAATDQRQMSAVGGRRVKSSLRLVK